MKNAHQFYDFFVFEQTNTVLSNPDPVSRGMAFHFTQIFNLIKRVCFLY